MATMQADTPIELASMKEMTNEEIDALIHKIREQRLRPIRDYEAAQLLKEQARRAGLEAKLEKKFEMFKKELERTDRAIEKLEKRALEIRAMRLEIEDE